MEDDPRRIKMAQMIEEEKRRQKAGETPRAAFAEEMSEIFTDHDINVTKMMAHSMSTMLMSHIFRFREDDIVDQNIFLNMIIKAIAMTINEIFPDEISRKQVIQALYGSCVVAARATSEEKTN